jgi:serine/threonine protein phosphatase 1
LDSAVFDRFLGRRTVRDDPPSTGGRLVYAVGDVHGRADLLRPLMRDIAQDVLATRPKERPLLVFLGDYVDRGPASRQVVDLILQTRADGAFEVVSLKGNHEEALLEFLDDPSFAEVWTEYGGAATLASYGVWPVADDPWERVRDAFAKTLPEAHLAFFRGLELVRIVGDYAFVHAGVRPRLPLEAQSEHDLLWIRYEFLQDPGPFEKVIVHGHTPAREPEMLKHRLGLDTGAFATGVLTAVRLYGEEQRVMQARTEMRAA